MSTERDPVVAVFSPLSGSRETIDFGLAASRLTGAPLTVAVVRKSGPMVEALAGQVDDAPDSARTLEHLRIDLKRRHADADVRVFEARTEAKALEHVRKELKPRLLVLEPRHENNLGAAILGSTLERVIHESACPVAVVPAGYRRPEQGVQLVGAAFTPTEEGREALQAAAAIVRAGGVRMRAITVLDPEHAGEAAEGMLADQHRDADPGAEAGARKGLAERKELEAAVAALGVPAETDVLFEKDPAEGLIAAAREVDLLVIGSRSRGARRAVLLGSVSRKVAEHAECPVLIVPRAAAGSTEAALAHAPSGTAE